MGKGDNKQTVSVEFLGLLNFFVCDTVFLLLSWGEGRDNLLNLLICIASTNEKSQAKSKFANSLLLTPNCGLVLHVCVHRMIA